MCRKGGYQVISLIQIAFEQVRFCMYCTRNNKQTNNLKLFYLCIERSFSVMNIRFLACSGMYF